MLTLRDPWGWVVSRTNSHSQHNESEARAGPSPTTTLPYPCRAGARGGPPTAILLGWKRGRTRAKADGKRHWKGSMGTPGCSSTRTRRRAAPRRRRLPATPTRRSTCSPTYAWTFCLARRRRVRCSPPTWARTCTLRRMSPAATTHAPWSRTPHARHPRDSLFNHLGAFVAEATGQHPSEIVTGEEREQHVRDCSETDGAMRKKRKTGKKGKKGSRRARRSQRRVIQAGSASYLSTAFRSERESYIIPSCNCTPPSMRAWQALRAPVVGGGEVDKIITRDQPRARRGRRRAPAASPARSPGCRRGAPAVEARLPGRAFDERGGGRRPADVRVARGEEERALKVRRPGAEDDREVDGVEDREQHEQRGAAAEKQRPRDRAAAPASRSKEDVERDGAELLARSSGATTRGAAVAAATVSSVASGTS